ncbi:MAG TPA: hypothetical protein VD793_10150, partial [Gemmatimonadales bacterium]|nr:hypothetical protein [Gemmatimonadales bacterium]
MRRIWHIVLVTAALGLPAGPATGQTAPADTAAVLLEAARRLEAAGNHRVAEALLALVARDYAGTPSG